MTEQLVAEQRVKFIIQETLAEQARLHDRDIDELVLKTVARILTSFGIEKEDRAEMRADFIHLRKWRKSVDAATGLTFKVVVTTIISGFVAAVWVGFKILVGK